MKERKSLLPPGVVSVYRGKVRDVFQLENGQVLMVCSNRISAFDHMLPKEIPCKGAILNQLSGIFLKQTAQVFPNWLESIPHPQVSVGKYCTPIRIEMVVRGYLCGHAWRIYRDGGRSICGVNLPEGLQEHSAFDQAILTPTLKLDNGHDQDISSEEILNQGLVAPEVYKAMEEASLNLYRAGHAYAKTRGLVLLDTKYEFGMHEQNLLLMDEIHTPDSSRYAYADGFGPGKPIKQLSKEFVRHWLIERGFQGLEGQQMPSMEENDVWQIRERYLELFEQLTGNKPACRAPIGAGELLDLIAACLETK